MATRPSGSGSTDHAAGDDAPPDRQRIPSLDGLRGVAILLVLVFHGLDIQQDAIPFPVIHAIAISGWTGVSLFFVLSGFLITGILLDTPRGRRGIGNFYARRALRILPLYYVTLLIFFYVLPRGPLPELAWHDERQLLYWTFLQNWAMAAHGAFLDSPNLNHLWSLNIEEQFYILWPLLVIGLRRRRLLWLCAALIVGCLGLRVALYSQGVPWVSIYISTITRIDDLAVGAAIACLFRGPAGLAQLVPVARVVGTGCLLYVIGRMIVDGGLLLGEAWTTTLGYSIASLGFGSALICVLCARTDGIVARVLSSRVLVMFGKYSYGLYVVHLPIVLLLMVPPGGYIDLPGTVAYAMHLTIMIALSFSAALASWYVIELPFLKLKSGFVDRADSPGSPD